jgi:hypothetical protein
VQGLSHHAVWLTVADALIEANQENGLSHGVDEKYHAAVRIGARTAKGGCEDAEQSHPFTRPRATVRLNGERLGAGAERERAAGRCGRHPGYGAKDNGSTDGLRAIQKAFSAAPAGGLVVFPVGLYRVMTELVITKPVSLMGLRLGS